MNTLQLYVKKSSFNIVRSLGYMATNPNSNSTPPVQGHRTPWIISSYELRDRVVMYVNFSRIRYGDEKRNNQLHDEAIYHSFGA